MFFLGFLFFLSFLSTTNFFGHSLFLVKPKIFAVQGQRGPKRGFPTLRCDAPKGGWRCNAATLRRSGGRVALRRCQGPATLWRCDAATLQRCRWASDAATLLALRRCDAGVTLRRCRRCDAATRERRCDAVGAATLRRCDAGATLRRCWCCDAATRERRCHAGATLRRCWRCDASFCKSAHSVASRRDTLDVYFVTGVNLRLAEILDVDLRNLQHKLLISRTSRN